MQIYFNNSFQIKVCLFNSFLSKFLVKVNHSWAAPCNFTPKQHKVIFTGSQNGWGWQRPPEVILSSLPTQAGPPTAGCPGQRPDGSRVSAWTETPWPLWATHYSAQSPSQYKSVSLSIPVLLGWTPTQTKSDGRPLDPFLTAFGRTLLQSNQQESAWCPSLCWGAGQHTAIAPRTPGNSKRYRTNVCSLCVCAFVCIYASPTCI